MELALINDDVACWLWKSLWSRTGKLGIIGRIYKLTNHWAKLSRRPKQIYQQTLILDSIILSYRYRIVAKLLNRISALETGVRKVYSKIKFLRVGRYTFDLHKKNRNLITSTFLILIFFFSINFKRF